MVSLPGEVSSMAEARAPQLPKRTLVDFVKNVKDDISDLRQALYIDAEALTDRVSDLTRVAECNHNAGAKHTI